MARWKLVESHYLQVPIGDPNAEWEYSEVDRTTGRQRRKKFSTPRMLNINDPLDWTNKWGNKDNEEGEIIVCLEGKGEPRDIVFIGDPTPGMVPLDDEAREISKSFETRWSYKPETAEVTYSQSLIDKNLEAMAANISKPVEVPGLSELTAAIAAMAQTNQAILQQLASGPPKPPRL